MKSIAILALGMFALGFDAYVVAGLLPGIATAFGVRSGEAGQAVTVFTLAYAMAAPLCAALLAGKPVRRVLGLALAVFTLANLLSAVATSLGGLLLARAIAGLAAGLYAPVAITSAAALVASGRKGRALALILGGMSSGTVIGVPAGLWIAERFGWQGALWMVTILGAVATAAILWRLPDIQAAEPPSWRARAALLTHPPVVATVAVTFLTAIASLGLYTYLALLLDREGLGGVAAGYFWAWGIGGMVGSFSVGPLIDRTGDPGRLMAFILALLTLALASLGGLLGTSPLGYLTLVIWGAMGWASQAPQQHALLQLRPEQGSVAVALNSSANYLGGAAGAALGGVVVTYAGLSAVPTAAAAVAAAGLALQVAILARVRRVAAG